MLRVRWLVNLLSCQELLRVYDELGKGRLPRAQVDQRLLDVVAMERREELGGWPLHQEVAARPSARTVRSTSLVLEALTGLARRYLVWHAGAIEFRPDRLLEWRENFAHRIDIDLIVMAAAALDVWGDPENPTPRQLDERTLHQITAAPMIPGVALPDVSRLAAAGLVETHRHLTLACLPSIVWCSALATSAVEPKEAAPSLYSNWSQLLRHARAIRETLLDLVLSKRQDEASRQEETNGLDALGVPALVRTLSREAPVVVDTDRAMRLYGARPGSTSRERALLVHAIQQAARGEASSALSWLLHAYVVLRNVTAAQIVQPTSGRKGLDRFKIGYVESPWHSLNPDGVREGVHQAWRTGGVRWLEGKVTPSRSVEEHLRRILPPPNKAGLTLARLYDAPVSVSTLLKPEPEEERPAVRLTFHFIREPDEAPSTTRMRRIAFTGLRERIHEQALRILDDVTRTEYAPFVVGLDVASMETDAPIEVFAPLLRAMRSPWPVPPSRLPGQKRSALRDFGLAVHAGEEFRHLAEGIRRVVETIDFCGYRAGDRIGHALSLGIEPLSWAERWGRVAIVPCQVRLDDLVWMWEALDGDTRHTALRVRLPAEARSLFQRIYRRPFPGMDVLSEAWRLRAEDPLSYRELQTAQIPTLGPLRRHMRRSLECALRDKAGEGEKIWWDTLTDPEVSALGAQALEVELKRDEMLALRDLQDVVLRRLVRERIAIEVNPSSNLSIGPFSRVAEHPIFRWAPLEGGDESLRPIVVVGSDDPAIFGSELVHEYALLFLAAEEHSRSQRVAARWLRELHEDAWAYRFGINGTSGLMNRS